ncbi:MAG: hypothetical protein M3Y33_19430 [Actinomycetota bacterium]|nr:hypothetical protein [Actinomycetota bacterium]
MHLAQFTLVASRQAATPVVNAALIVDLIWTAAEEGDCVEHISAHTEPSRIDIGILMRAHDESGTYIVACEILNRARIMSPVEVPGFGAHLALCDQQVPMPALT